MGTFLLQPYFQEAKGTAIAMPIPRHPGQTQPSCERTDGCRPSSPMPACARWLNGQRSSSSALSDFSNDRSRSLGQVGKAAEPPHAPRHAACKTSEREGWKPYRIIQGKASCPAPAQPRRGKERSEELLWPPGNGTEQWWFWGRKQKLNRFGVAMRHLGFGERRGPCTGQDYGKNARQGKMM